MQNHAQQIHGINTTGTPIDYLLKDALGVTSPFAQNICNPVPEINITQQQIEILEDAIRRYERLEDVKRFSSLVLEDVEYITEDDIKRALEAEKAVSIEDEKAVLALIQNEGFLKDLDGADFSALLEETAEQDFSDFDL